MATIFWLSIYGVHIGATWRIRLNRPCAAAMRSVSNYFDHLLMYYWFDYYHCYCLLILTRHGASTSMYSLTFCVRVMSAERHHWNLEARSPGRRSNVENAPRRQTITHAHLRYTARNIENASVTRWSLISNARTPRVN